MHQPEKVLFSPNMSGTAGQARQVLGRGAFGTVYLGQNAAGQAVAIKEVSRIDPNEIDIMCRVCHPNIIYAEKVSRSASNPNMLAIQMPLIPYTMKSFPSALPEFRKHEISTRIIQAFAAIHRLGIVHRDIKTENILMDQNGHPVVADFGLAMPMFPGKNYYATLGFSGTPSSSAPELVVNGEKGRAKMVYSDVTDAWSIGFVLYMLWSDGIKPYEVSGGFSWAGVRKAVNSFNPMDKIQQLRCPAVWKEIMLLFLQRDPTLRSTPLYVLPLLKNAPIRNPSPTSAEMLIERGSQFLPPIQPDMLQALGRVSAFILEKLDKPINDTNVSAIRTWLVAARIIGKLPIVNPRTVLSTVYASKRMLGPVLTKEIEALAKHMGWTRDLYQSQSDVERWLDAQLIDIALGTNGALRDNDVFDVIRTQGLDRTDQIDAVVRAALAQSQDPRAFARLP